VLWSEKSTFFWNYPAIYFCFQSLWTEFIFDLSDFFPETLSLSDTALQFFGPPGMKLTRTAQGSFDAVRLAAARTSVGLFLGMTMQLGLALFLSSTLVLVSRLLILYPPLLSAF